MNLACRIVTLGAVVLGTSALPAVGQSYHQETSPEGGS
jgi:hypothetical protein